MKVWVQSICRPFRFAGILWRFFVHGSSGRLQFYMKSGNCIEVELSEWKYNKTMDGGKKFEWKSATGCADNALVSIDMDQVEAIVRLL